MATERREEHNMTSREALKMFENSGLMRSQRSIERYCRDEKLDCFFDADEQRYYITRASAERLIGQLKEIMARHEQLPDVVPGPTSTANASRQAPPPVNEEHEAAHAAKLKELEDKVFNLEIDKRVRDQFVIQLKDQVNADRQFYTQQLKEYTQQLVDYSRQVGELETKLKQLEAPRHQKADNIHSVPSDGIRPPIEVSAEPVRESESPLDSTP
jgi:DNA repair exonuclease SbcCD ATPase subunit